MNHKSDVRFNDEQLAELWNNTAMAMKAMGMRDKELDDLRFLIENSIKSSKKQQPLVEDCCHQKADSIKILANEQFKNQDYSAAIELYSSAILLEGIEDNVLAVLYCNRSLAYLRLHMLMKSKSDKDLCKALNDAKQCIELDPT